MLEWWPGLCEPAIFGSLPWSYVMCNWAQILTCWKHFSSKLTIGIGHIRSFMNFVLRPNLTSTYTAFLLSDAMTPCILKQRKYACSIRKRMIICLLAPVVSQQTKLFATLVLSIVIVAGAGEGRGERWHGDSCGDLAPTLLWLRVTQTTCDN